VDDNGDGSPIQKITKMKESRDDDDEDGDKAF